MKIYWIRAQAPRRVLALAKHLGLAPELVELDLLAGDLKSPDYLRLNPNGKAPTLVDGDIVLWESSAIMAYLCTKVGSDLWPASDFGQQAEVLRWLSWNDNHWAPAIAPFYFEHVVKPTFGLGPPDPDALSGREPDVMRWASVLDHHLSDTTHVACGRLTIADFQLASMAAYWRISGLPFHRTPAVARWLEALAKVPAWRSPWPDGPDAALESGHD